MVLQELSIRVCIENMAEMQCAEKLYDHVPEKQLMLKDLRKLKDPSDFPVQTDHDNHWT